MSHPPMIVEATIPFGNLEHALRVRDVLLEKGAEVRILHLGYARIVNGGTWLSMQPEDTAPTIGLPTVVPPVIEALVRECTHPLPVYYHHQRGHEPFELVVVRLAEER